MKPEDCVYFIKAHIFLRCSKRYINKRQCIDENDTYVKYCKEFKPNFIGIVKKVLDKNNKGMV